MQAAPCLLPNRPDGLPVVVVCFTVVGRGCVLRADRLAVGNAERTGRAARACSEHHAMGQWARVLRRCKLLVRCLLDESSAGCGLIADCAGCVAAFGSLCAAMSCRSAAPDPLARRPLPLPVGQARLAVVRGRRRVRRAPAEAPAAPVAVLGRPRGGGLLIPVRAVEGGLGRRCTTRGSRGAQRAPHRGPAPELALRDQRVLAGRAASVRG
mmetsp:Transcript_102315/g.289304  ORF Transcript_102315/g.289304 Transcript_102315/m.289304 type:complete len:211 (+) Transcript_102315:969-1601(+)